MKKRQINKAKKYSNGCRNRGSCDYCKSSRTHANKRAIPADEKEQLNTNVIKGNDSIPSLPTRTEGVQ